MDLNFQPFAEFVDKTVNTFFSKRIPFYFKKGVKCLWRAAWSSKRRIKIDEEGDSMRCDNSYSSFAKGGGLDVVYQRMDDVAPAGSWSPIFEKVKKGRFYFPSLLGLPIGFINALTSYLSVKLSVKLFLLSPLSLKTWTCLRVMNTFKGRVSTFNI